MKDLELPSLLEEAKAYCEDENSRILLERLFDFEKGHPYSYKKEIMDMINACLEVKK